MQSGSHLATFQYAHGGSFCDRLLLDCNRLLLILDGLRCREVNNVVWGLVKLVGLRFKEVNSVLPGLDKPSEIPSKEGVRPDIRGGTDWSCSKRLGLFTLTCSASDTILCMLLLPLDGSQSTVGMTKPLRQMQIPRRVHLHRYVGLWLVCFCWIVA